MFGRYHRYGRDAVVHDRLSGHLERLWEVLADLPPRIARFVERIHDAISSAHAPVPADDDFATDADTTISGNLFADNGRGVDHDRQRDAIVVIEAAGQAGNLGNPFAVTSEGGRTGSLTVDANGDFTFMPDDGFADLSEGETDIVTFEYRIADERGIAGSKTGIVTITVTGVNDAPEIESDIALAAGADGSTSLDLATVVRDPDSDQAGPGLAYAITSEPGLGGASIDGATFLFDPGDDFLHLAEGEAQSIYFALSATDVHGAVTEGEVGVTVTGANDTPTVSLARTQASSNPTPRR